MAVKFEQITVSDRDPKTGRVEGREDIPFALRKVKGGYKIIRIRKGKDGRTQHRRRL